MATLALPPVADLAATMTLAETLRPVIGEITIDGSAVERIGVAGLQLLLSAHGAAAAAGHALTIDRPSPLFVQAATTAGIADVLMIDATSPVATAR